jgi:hypothetical protein
MQFEQIGPQWRREMFRATERLEHAAPFLVEAGVPIGIRSRRLRQCILRGRTDPQADVGGCARREYESSPPPAPRSPAEKLVDALAAHRDGQRGTQPHAELWVNGAAGANAQDDIITAALAWSELRPFFRERLVGVTSFFERQSRTSASRKGSTHDGDSHAAARRCILAAQLELDSDVPSCVRDATSGGDLEFVATGNSPRRDRMFAR